jgi:hypothetical protein
MKKEKKEKCWGCGKLFNSEQLSYCYYFVSPAKYCKECLRKFDKMQSEAINQLKDEK